MYGFFSLMTGVTFTGNTAGDVGGGMGVDNNGKESYIVNTIFWGNSDSTGRNQIYLNTGNSGDEKISIL